MAKFTSIETMKLEKFLGMGGGYVLDFSNRTFQQFIFEHSHRDIYDDRYSSGGNSKANRLRTFWHIESGPVVAKLMTDLLEYWKARKLTMGEDLNKLDEALYEDCLKIAARVRNDSIVDDVDAFQPNVEDKNFQVLAQIIRESIEKNEPEKALDRLHTFVVKFLRKLCDRHGISYTGDTPLHTLFGSYIKCLKNQNLIESEMTERILKSSISVLEAFNDVRNKQSLAHDNIILNYPESVLIFNDIANVVRFIDSIEQKQISEEAINSSMDEIPF